MIAILCWIGVVTWWRAVKNDHLTIRASKFDLDFPFEDLFSNEEETFFDYIDASHAVGLS